MSDTENVYPPGEYAIVELFGHTTLVGRIAEVERFGTKMLAIELLFQRTLLPPVYYGGNSIYGLTPCTVETAFARAPKNQWSLPRPIAVTLPAALLEAPAPQEDGGDDEGESDG